MPQEVLQQDLRAQVEEVGRLVEQQQVRLVEQQGGELHARLPAAGEPRDRPAQIVPLDLEFAGHLAAFPLGLAAITDQEFERSFARQKRIVLAEIAQAEAGMTEDFAAVELFFAQQNAQQRALARPVAADEADLHIVGNCRLGMVQ